MDLYRKITSLEMELAVLKQKVLSEDMIRCIVHDELNNIRHQCPTCKTDRLQGTVSDSGHSGEGEPGPPQMEDNNSISPADWERNRIIIDFEERDNGICAADLTQQFLADETSSSSGINVTERVSEVKAVVAASEPGTRNGQSAEFQVVCPTSTSTLGIGMSSRSPPIVPLTSETGSLIGPCIEIVDISNDDDMTLKKASVDGALWRNRQLMLKLKRLEDEMIHGLGERLKLQIAKNKAFLDSNRRFNEASVSLSSKVTPNLKEDKERSEQTINSPQKYGCYKCTGLFLSTEMQNNHVCVDEKNGEIYQCPFCASQFATKEEFTRHLQDVHAL